MTTTQEFNATQDAKPKLEAVFVEPVYTLSRTLISRIVPRLTPRRVQAVRTLPAVGRLRLFPDLPVRRAGGMGIVEPGHRDCR